MLLLHRVDDGCLVVPGKSRDELSAHVSGVYPDSLPPISIDITHESPLTDSWVGPLFAFLHIDGGKSMNPNATDIETETNCTLFVMHVLRLLGGGGVVDLSQEAVCGHLSAMGIPATAAQAAAQRWVELWGRFLATPNLRVDGGFRKELKPVLKSVMTHLMKQRMVPAASRVAVPPPNHGRKRKHASQAA